MMNLCKDQMQGGPPPHPPISPVALWSSRDVLECQAMRVRFAIAFSMLIVSGCVPGGMKPDPAPSYLDVQAPSGHRLAPIQLDGMGQLESLLADEDTDGDHLITVSDPTDGERGNRRSEIVDEDGARYEVAGTYALSNLLQEITLAMDGGRRMVTIDPGRIWEAPTHRIERSIREMHWDGLTRRIDGENLGRILGDDKLATGSARRFLFVPHNDAAALSYFCAVAAQRPGLRLQIERLPATVTPAWVRSLDPHWKGKRRTTADPCPPGTGAGRIAPMHGLLVLGLAPDALGNTSGVPFVVPGGRFNEMYGWDSYFEALGLLADGRIDLAKAMVDNFVYQIVHYGKILNANRTYYLTRSQPPFLTSMISAVYQRMVHSEASRAWLQRSLLAAIREYEDVWMGADRLTSTGLSRYYGSGIGAPPEVEPGHFDLVFERQATANELEKSVYEDGYRAGDVSSPELDRYFVHDRCMRESGHDTTYRWDRRDRGDGGNRCADFTTVDLNSLLYKTEVDVAWLIREELGDRLIRPDGSVETSAVWYERASKRRDRILTYLWDDERSMFFDYDLATKSRHAYVSATTLYPLWAWNPADPNSRLLSDDQAGRLVDAALPVLEMQGGVAASGLASRGELSAQRPQRQWDYPHGWAPHQMLVWQGLRNHGFDDVADRLTYKWLYTITINAVEYNGTVPEKFDVVRRSHRVFAEYGNVGTDFDYITREGFGWMNASYQVGLRALSPSLRSTLDRLVAPEWIDFTSEPPR